MRARSKWIPALFFVLLPVVPLWKAIFLGLCIGPFDQIRQMAPWHGGTTNQPWDVLQADGVLQFFPWRDLVFHSWANFKPPFWNPYELAGTPLLANSQSAGFYPPLILLGFLHLSTPLGILLLAWGHLTWAGLGVYGVCRRLGGSGIAAAIGGASFALAPFMLSWTALSSVIVTVSWIPWCLAFTLDIFDQAPQKGLKPLPFATIKLAACVAMLFLAGHLQFAAYGMMSIVIVAGCALLAGKAFTSNRATAAFGVALGLILGFLLATPQLLPVLTFSKMSNRQNQASEEGYAAYAGSAIKPFEFATISNPLALGNPREPFSEKNPGLSTYWPPLVKQGDNFAESAVTLGPFVMALLGLVAWKDRKVLPMAVLGVLALLLCTGTFLDRLLYFYVPGWSATGSPGRICVLFVMAACVLVGTVKLNTPVSNKKFLGLGTLLGLGIIFSFLGASLCPPITADMAPAVDAMRTGGSFDALTALLQSTAVAFIGLGLLLAPKAAKFRPVAIAIPVLICFLTGGLAWVTVGTPDLTVGGPPDQARVAYLNKEWPIIGSFGQKPPNTPPNISSLNRIHELGGYDSLLNRDTVALLNEINGEDSAPKANGNMMFVKNENIEGLRQAGVSYIGTGADLRPIPNALGRVTLASGTAQIGSEDLSQITLNLNGSGTLTLRDRNMAGWTATLDGATVPIQPGLWRIVNVPSPGTHVIQFSYSPPGLHLGLVLCALSFLVLLGIAVLAKRTREVSKELSQEAGEIAA